MDKKTFGKPPTAKRLNQMRKKMFLTFYQDLQLFGYQTEAVKSLCRQIRQAKRQGRE